MKLTLMAPFRVHFCLDSRALSHIYPSTAESYFAFWDSLAEDVTPYTAQSAALGDVRYLHTTKHNESRGLEYFSISTDTEIVPAATLVVKPRYTVEQLNAFWETAIQAEIEARKNNGDSFDEATARNWHRHFVTNPGSLQVTVFDNTIAIVETDLNIDLSKAALTPDAHNLKQFLTTIQGAGNRFIVALIDDYYDNALHSFLTTLYESQPAQEKYLRNPQTFKSFRDVRNVGNRRASRSLASSRVKWVTRTLHLPRDGRGSDDRTLYESITRSWLEDTGAYADANDIIANRRSFSFRWVNYVHWPRSQESSNKDLADGWESSLKYEDAWDALLLAQYFYSAIDALNVNLSLILGEAYSGAANNAIREINEALGDIMSRTKLVILNFREREKYLVRAKLDMLRNMIFDAWDFDDFVKQTEGKAELCEERVKQIHDRSSERSGLVTDILLLLIGTVSFFGLALDIARSAREFSTDSTIGLRDEGVFDILSRISGVPMDAVIGSAFISILAMALIYGLFRWRKLL